MAVAANLEVHHFPGGWAFFSSITTTKVDNLLFVGAFFTTERYPTSGVNDYLNSSDDEDLPLTAILIPF